MPTVRAALGLGNPGAAARQAIVRQNDRRDQRGMDDD